MWPTGWRLAFVILLVPSHGYAAGVSGVVLDPQDLAVRGARVELTCGDRTATVSTDSHGGFAAEVPVEDCLLSITHQGFTPFQQRLTGSPAALVVHLQVAIVQQHVDVVAPKPAATDARFGFVSLDAAEQDLKALSGTTSELIRHVQRLAGSATRPVSVNVDGLPASGLPPLETIGQLTLNADPFAAEYASGDVATIDIITKSPDRTFRVFAGGDVPGIAGRDALAPALHARSTFVSLGVMGPVPDVPLTFSVTAGAGRASQEVPIRAALPEIAEEADAAETTNRSGSGSVSIHYSPGPSLRARVSYRESRTGGSNVGVGGITLEEAGFASSYVTRDVRATATVVSPRVLSESGVAVSYAGSATRANRVTPGITIGGDLVMGGAPISDSQRNTSRWTIRQVVRSRSGRPWTLGASMTGAHESRLQTPNGGGTFYFADAAAYHDALAGASTGTWYVTRGGTPVSFRNLTAASFAQAEIVRVKRLSLNAGARADFQSGVGALVSPRLAVATGWRGLDVRAGAGLFARQLPESLFIGALENSGPFRQFVATDVSVAEPEVVRLGSAVMIRSRPTAGLAPPRALLWRVAVERPIGSLTPAFEYSFTDERRLPGSDRRVSESGWLDVVESDRRAARERLHGFARYMWHRQQLVIDYEFTRSRDNVDGPFSFPEEPGNLAAEWARSAGVPPHTLSVMGTLTLPGTVSLNVVDEWRSGAPFNITTALDTDGNGLTLNREGRERNSGDGPGFHSLSLYAHRRVAWPRVFKAPRGAGIHVSVQADNILDTVNYLSVGSIAGSASFGQPLAAYPGRSIRLLVSID